MQQINEEPSVVIIGEAPESMDIQDDAIILRKRKRSPTRAKELVPSYMTLRSKRIKRNTEQSPQQEKSDP